MPKRPLFCHGYSQNYKLTPAPSEIASQLPPLLTFEQLIYVFKTFHSLGVLLKFSDDPVATKFDLAMNSGVACPFYDYNTFMEFGRAIVNRENGNMEAYKKYLLSSPSNW
jgi:hypothetical protein